MKVNNKIVLIIGLLILLVLVSSINILAPLWSTIAASPWWTYLILAGVIISGFMSFRYTKEEFKSEQQYIEQEGEVYMKRLAAEKERRKKLSS